MVDRDGQQLEFSTVASVNVIQSRFELMYGILATDSIVWSSVNTRTMFGRISGNAARDLRATAGAAANPDATTNTTTAIRM
jgi:hypothetical protein